MHIEHRALGNTRISSAQFANREIHPLATDGPVETKGLSSRLQPNRSPFQDYIKYILKERSTSNQYDLKILGSPLIVPQIPSDTVPTTLMLPLIAAQVSTTTPLAHGRTSTNSSF